MSQPLRLIIANATSGLSDMVLLLSRASPEPGRGFSVSSSALPRAGEAPAYQNGPHVYLRFRTCPYSLNQRFQATTLRSFAFAIHLKHAQIITIWAPIPSLAIIYRMYLPFGILGNWWTSCTRKRRTYFRLLTVRSAWHNPDQGISRGRLLMRGSRPRSWTLISSAALLNSRRRSIITTSCLRECPNIARSSRCESSTPAVSKSRVLQVPLRLVASCI